MTRTGQGPDRRSGALPARNLGAAACITAAGGLWGLGLARLLGEATLWSLPYASPLLATVLASLSGIVVLGVWRLACRLHPSPAEHSWSFFLPLVLPFPYVIGTIPLPLAGGVLLAGSAALVLFTLWQDCPSWVLPSLLALVCLSFYLQTLLPTVGEADTFEFQVVVPQLGVAHPTGYPLFVLLGKLFTLLPLKNMAWRVNLASAVFGAGAVVVIHGVLRRLTGSHSPSGADLRGAGNHGLVSESRDKGFSGLLPFLTALAVAFSATFWSQAIIAEVYTLHNLLVMAILGLLLREKAGPTDTERAARWRWQAVFFLLGLGLTNHLTMALLVPAVVLSALWDERERAIADWFCAAGLFLLGLSLYLFVPLRWPALNDGQWMTLRDFLNYVTGGQFHGALRLDGWQDPTRWRIVARLFLQPFGWPGIALAAVGVINLGFRRRRALAVTGITFLAFFVYGLAYYVADIAVFLLPGQLILAIWMGVGVASLAGLLSAQADVARAIGRPLIIASFALVPLSSIWVNLPGVDRSQDRGREHWGRYVLRLPLEKGSAILADPKRFAPLYYLQQVEGLRSDLDMVLLGTEELYQADLRRRLGEGQTVYLGRYLPRLEGFYLRSVGPLAEVRTEPPSEVVASKNRLARLGDAIQLLDATVAGDPLGRTLYHVTLQWKAGEPVDRDLVPRLRLVDSEGAARWTSGGVRPVNGLYPTNAWPADVAVTDYHEVVVPPWLPPDTYSLQVGLFPSFSEDELLLDGASDPWVPLGELDIVPPSTPRALAGERSFSFGEGVWLTGWDAPQEAQAAAPVAIDLAWRGIAQDEAVELLWVDDEGRRIGAGVFVVAATMVRSRHIITVPDQTGLYSLRVSLVDRPARCGWLASPRPDCPLADVRVAASMEDLANFGGRLVLTDARVGRLNATSGDIVPVTLRWRGLRAMEEDYTVFVHLVGPDGRLHGQVDSWPVQGSYPTSQWVTGKVVIDDYEVRLEPDAPPGPYRVEVGLYRLETMERLRILDDEGNAIGDAILVDTFDVQQ